jgi:hypothetical protein
MGGCDPTAVVKAARLRKMAQTSCELRSREVEGPPLRQLCAALVTRPQWTFSYWHAAKQEPYFMLTTFVCRRGIGRRRRRWREETMVDTNEWCTLGLATTLEWDVIWFALRYWSVLFCYYLERKVVWQEYAEENLWAQETRNCNRIEQTAQ